MKIAFVYDAVYPWVKGGAEKRIYEIGRRLVKRGHEVHLFGVKWWEGEDEIEFEGMILHGVCSSRSLYTNGRRSIIQALGFSISLFRPLLKEKFDVIDVSVFPYFSCFTAKAVSVIRRTPLVLTWHEVWDDYWYEYMGRIGFFGLTVERIVSRLGAHNITVSQFTKEKLEKINRNTCPYVIANGIDLSQIKRIPPASEALDIIFAGRLIKEKNVGLLIQALAQVREKMPQIKTGIIGDGPEKEELQTSCRDTGIANNITFYGFMEYQGLIGSMKNSKIFVLPSLREGFGMVVIEAFACGLPVVAVNSPMNAARYLINEKNGIIVENDSKSLATGITQLLDKNESSWKKMSQDATETSRSFDWESIVTSLQNKYGTFA